MTIPKRYFDSIPRVILSFALAYPISGVTLAVVSLVRNPSFVFTNPSGAVLNLVVGSVWFGLTTPMIALGLLKPGGDVPDLNMYPYIIVTACIIFFLLSKGWRWCRRR
jgi:hypothetical protein